MIPSARILALGCLLVTVQRGSFANHRRRIRVHRTVKFIGRWSLVDVFVDTITAALVRLQPLMRGAAFRQPAVDPQTYRLVFSDSVRGLTPGAPVELRGIPVGEVASVTGQLDPQTFQSTAPVVIRAVHRGADGTARSGRATAREAVAGDSRDALAA